MKFHILHFFYVDIYLSFLKRTARLQCYSLPLHHRPPPSLLSSLNTSTVFFHWKKANTHELPITALPPVFSLNAHHKGTKFPAHAITSQNSGHSYPVQGQIRNMHPIIASNEKRVIFDGQFCQRMLSSSNDVFSNYMHLCYSYTPVLLWKKNILSQFMTSMDAGGSFLIAERLISFWTEIMNIYTSPHLGPLISIAICQMWSYINCIIQHWISLNYWSYT